MKINKTSLSALFAGIILSSCTLYRNVPIEILRTPESVLPAGNNQIALLYRNFKYEGDTLMNYFRDDDLLKKDIKGQMENIDSLLVFTCMNKVATLFEEKKVCSAPVIFPVDMMPRVTGDKLFPVSPQLIRKLAFSSNASYVISLETFTCFFVHYQEKTQARESQHVALAGIWVIYNGRTGDMIEKKSITDTVYWNSDETAISSGKERLPPRITALQQAAETFGETYASRFYQEWIKVDRLLVVPPLEEFRIADNYAADQDWEKAVALWEKYSPERFGKLAVTANYNLALAFEIRDDLETALLKIKQAYKLASAYKNRDEIKMVESYMRILSMRKIEIEKFNQSSKQ